MRRAYDRLASIPDLTRSAAGGGAC